MFRLRRPAPGCGPWVWVGGDGAALGSDGARSRSCCSVEDELSWKRKRTGSRKWHFTLRCCSSPRVATEHQSETRQHRSLVREEARHVLSQEMMSVHCSLRRSRTEFTGIVGGQLAATVVVVVSSARARHRHVPLHPVLDQATRRRSLYAGEPVLPLPQKHSQCQSQRDALRASPGQTPARSPGASGSEDCISLYQHPTIC